MKKVYLVICLLLVPVWRGLCASSEVEGAKVAYEQERTKARTPINIVLAKSGATLLASLPPSTSSTARKIIVSQLNEKPSGAFEGTPHPALAKLFADYDKALATAIHPIRTKYLAKLQGIAAKQSEELAKETLAIAAYLENTGRFTRPPSEDGSVTFENGPLPEGWKSVVTSSSAVKSGIPQTGLTLTAPPAATLLATKNLDAPRVLNACKEDFECYATIHFSTKTAQPFAGAGFTVWLDVNHFWRLVVCGESSGASVEFGRLKAGEWKVVKKKDRPEESDTVDLRMVRRGPILEASYRPTGTSHWIHLNQSLLPDGLPVPELLVGPVVANETANPVSAAFTQLTLLETQTDPNAAAEALVLEISRKKRDEERRGKPTTDPDPIPDPDPVTTTTTAKTGPSMIEGAGEVFRQNDQAILANLATSTQFPKTVDPATGAPIRDPASHKYPILQESLKDKTKAKGITEITESAISDWGDSVAITVGGKPGWRIPLRATAKTIFGNVEVRVHAIVIDASVAGWFYSGSGEPVL